MKAIRLLIAVTILLVSSSCAIYHHYGPYYGKVVDAETNKPLEGAVVLADYITWLHASPGGPGAYFLDAQETVTDKNGEFRIPSLNAFAFRPLSRFEPNPYFTIFKPRYECYRGSTKFKPNYSLPEDKYVTIELRELKTREERLKHTGCYPDSVPLKRMRRLIEQYNIERVDLGLDPIFEQEVRK